MFAKVEVINYYSVNNIWTWGGGSSGAGASTLTSWYPRVLKKESLEHVKGSISDLDKELNERIDKQQPQSCIA